MVQKLLYCWGCSCVLSIVVLDDRGYHLYVRFIQGVCYVGAKPGALLNLYFSFRNRDWLVLFYGRFVLPAGL